MIAYFLFISNVRNRTTDMLLFRDLDNAKIEEGRKSQLAFIVSYILLEDKNYQVHWRTETPFRPANMVDYVLTEESIKEILDKWQITLSRKL